MSRYHRTQNMRLAVTLPELQLSDDERRTTRILLISRLIDNNTTFAAAYETAGDPLTAAAYRTKNEELRAELARLTDPQTDKQRDIAQWQAETVATREGDRPL